MKWRDKLELNEIKITNNSNLETSCDSLEISEDKRTKEPTQHNVQYKKNIDYSYHEFSMQNQNLNELDAKWANFNHLLKKSFKKKEVDLPKNEQLNQQDENPIINEILSNPSYKKAVFEKDLSALAVLFFSFLGIISMISPSQIPAIERDYFLGIDINLWWIFVKLLGVLFGSLWCMSVVWKLRGVSKRLGQLFSFLPNSGKYSLKMTTTLFVGALLFNNGLQVMYPHIFKSAAEWKNLESLKIDSRDPIKRAEFAGMIKGLDSQDVVPNVANKSYSTSEPILLSPAIPPPDSKLDPQLAESIKNLNELSEASKAFQEEMSKQIIERDKMINEITKTQKK